DGGTECFAAILRDARVLRQAQERAPQDEVLEGETPMTRARYLVLALAATALLAAQAPASADDVLKLTIGQRGNWDTAISQLGEKAGIFKKHGLTLEMVYT